MENAAPSLKKSLSNLLEKGGRKTVVTAKYRSPDTDYSFLLLFLFSEQILSKYY